MGSSFRALMISYRGTRSAIVMATSESYAHVIVPAREHTPMVDVETLYQGRSYQNAVRVTWHLSAGGGYSGQHSLRAESLMICVALYKLALSLNARSAFYYPRRPRGSRQCHSPQQRYAPEHYCYSSLLMVSPFSSPSWYRSSSSRYCTVGVVSLMSLSFHSFRDRGICLSFLQHKQPTTVHSPYLAQTDRPYAHSIRGHLRCCHNGAFIRVTTRIYTDSPESI